MKNILFLFLTTFYLSACVTSSAKSTWFPSEVFYHSNALSEYITNIDYSDQNTIRKEYLIILAFINETIIARQENIENLLARIPIVRRPALINGFLSLVETKIPVSEMWDIDLEQSVLLPDSNVKHDEIIQLLISVHVYNALIDFWYNKTAELLHEHINHKSIENKIQDIIMYYESIIN